MDLFQGIRDNLDRRPNARIEYETSVASKGTILDVGGRNQQSRSNKRLRRLSTNPNAQIVATDILEDYKPDLVDDICNSKIESNRFDAVYCDAILEHVHNYDAAVAHIHRILKPGGELFLYVPFFWCFHDNMDHHRFTFTEVDRMLSRFSRHKLFLPDDKGYGGVFWQLLTYYQINSFPGLHRLLAKCVNALLAVPLTLKYKLASSDAREYSASEYRFYFTHLFVNHGFCGWAVK